MSPAVDVLTAIAASGVVPVVVLDDADDAVPLLTALREAGLPLAEITFRTPAAGDAIRAVVDAGLAEGPDGALVGAGTVTTEQEVDAAVAAGARFVVSPGFSRAVIERCREHGVPVVPGAVTATEIQACLAMDLHTVKFFPAATSGGPAAIKALAGPFGSVRMIPTGGIGPDNLADYLSLPSVVAVGGSWMVPRSAVRANDFDEIRRLAGLAVRLAGTIRDKE
jgi:2-dehydro-3-deoxyphosphogluconate aldolase/(4S)-4-hydroxy-2-oxoglutarate aldolase